MSDEVWVYEGRNSQARVFRNFEDARREQDEDNRCSVEEILAEGQFEVGGSEEAGYFYIDDGGSIFKVTIE